MSDLQDQIERLAKLTNGMDERDLLVRRLARELRELAERVRERERSRAA
jgi:hypothetical protein